MDKYRIKELKIKEFLNNEVEQELSGEKIGRIVVFPGGQQLYFYQLAKFLDFKSKYIID